MSLLKSKKKTPPDKPTGVVIEFLPDADEIEQSPLPWLAKTTLYLLLILLMLFITWATVSEVDTIVSARGRLVTSLPNVVVQPLETSIIERLNVQIGQVIKKGDQLATLDPTFTGADEAQLHNRLASLTTQVSRLEAELSGAAPQDTSDGKADTLLQSRLLTERKAYFKSQIKKMEEDIARLRAVMETNKQDQQSLASRVKLLKELEVMQENLLAKQYGARTLLLEAQQKRMEIERDLQQAQNRAIELKKELAVTEAEKSSFEKGWRQKIMEELLTTSRERDTVQEELQKAEKRHRLVTLLSPADAIVLDIAKLSPGSVARGAETLFTLVPLGAFLEAEVQIESPDVGYIKIGATTKLKVDTYPFQRHGGLDGKVRTISEDAFQRESSAGRNANTYYVARIAFGNAHLRNMPSHARLLPGMTTTAEIVVGKRTVMSYLLWPLMSAFGEAMREP